RRWLRETGEVLACKSILKKKLRTAVDIEDVRREAEIMRHMPEHPNLVTLKETYEDEYAVHLVMELCEGGELFDRIVARGHYTERAAAAVTKTIIEVVQVCHKHGVMHRDLKPENFLFANKKETAPLKAIDFGLSVFFKPGERFNEIVGSPYYMAPEVLKRNYGPEVDIWSAGVILYILLCGVPPFWAETEQGVAQAIIRSQLDFRRDPWPKVSEHAKDLIRKMLDPDQKRRLTAQQVLGFATGLYAGEAGTMDYSFFNVSIDLTDAGHEHMEDIIGLLFRHMKILQHSGVPQWIFDEISAISETSFHYQAKTHPISYATGISSKMRIYPTKHWLVGSSLPSKFNPAIVKKVLDEISPSNV
ncbi:hypothetical protein F2Q68_00045014, partial [Brassica cretica]